MEAVERSLEMDRVTTLVAAFGWKVVKQEFEDEKLIATIEKTVTPSEVVAPATTKL